MTPKWKSATAWLACAAMAWLLAAPAALSSNTAEPARLVEDVTGRILDELDARRAEFEANPELLKDLVREDLLPLLDQEYSARLILGRQSRGVPPEKLRAFADAMSTIIINRYSSGLLRFRQRDQMEVLPPNENDSERMTRVRTRVKLANGGFAPVDYVFRKTDEGWKVFDVTIEGVSYVLTFRNQIGPRVAADGIEQVTTELRDGRIEIADS